MPETILFENHFHNELSAYAYIEFLLWSSGMPTCPHCRNFENANKMNGKSTRVGTYKCYECRKPFTVKVGSIFQSSHIPLRLWLQAIYLITGTNDRIRPGQLSDVLGITLKSSLSLKRRILQVQENPSYIYLDKHPIPKRTAQIESWLNLNVLSKLHAISMWMKDIH